MTEWLSRREMLVRLSAPAVLAAAGCGRSSGSANAVHIATAAGGLNLTMSELLRQQKFLESFGLEPEVVAMSDGTKIVGGIYSGSLDLSPMSGFGQVFPAIERGADLKIINAATLLPGQAMFSAKPNVQSLKDLEGKVVGVGAIGALVHQLTASLLRKHSVDVSAVRFVNIGSVGTFSRASWLERSMPAPVPRRMSPTPSRTTCTPSRTATCRWSCRSSPIRQDGHPAA